MKLRFWGVRGSIPTPAQTTDDLWKLEKILEVAEEAGLAKNNIKSFIENLPPMLIQPIGGNTPTVELRQGDDIVILDAGSGLCRLGLELERGAAFSESDLYLAIEAGHQLSDYDRREMKSEALKLHLFISHSHWDHIQGFPFFTPAYSPASEIAIYGREARELARVFTGQQSPAMFPIPFSDLGAKISFHSVPAEGLKIGSFHIQALEVPHPGGSLAFRVKAGGRSLVYATDYEFLSIDSYEAGQFVDFIKNADIFISDAQYTYLEGAARGGWGHSTALGAIDLAMRGDVKALYMFHYDPAHTDAKLFEMLEKSRAYYTTMSGGGQMAIELAIEGAEVEM